MIQSMTRSWVLIDRNAVLHNVKEIKKLLTDKTEIMAIVKANAYGHGDSVISKLLENNGISMFAVSSIDEALNLRKAGVTSDILILGYTPEVHFHYLIEEDLIQNFLSLEYAKKLNDFASEYSVSIRGHIKVDTGMARLGIRYTDQEDGFEEICQIYELSHLICEGIFSHYSVADERDEENLAYTKRQSELFEEVLFRLKDKGIDFGKAHIQNSYGILNYQMNYDYVRPGLLLYGVTSDDQIKINSNPDFIPALSWYANVSCVKTIPAGSCISYGRNFICDHEMKVATLSVGYADGVPRAASNAGMSVLIHGKRCQILGNICMDQMIVDVTGLDVCEQDKATLVGVDGDERITIDEWSRCVHTINNDMLCRITSRVPRFYTKLK